MSKEAKQVKTFALLALALLSCGAQAQDWHVQLHGLSHHQTRLQASGEKWNEFNHGVGLRYQANKITDVQAGFYKNSQFKTSQYVIGNWLPIDLSNNVRVGVFGGVVNGYSFGNGKFIPAGGMAVRWQGERFSVTSRFLPKVENTETAVVSFELGVRF